MTTEISRREALRRLSSVLGGAVSAATIAEMMSPAAARAWTNVEAWVPETLTAAQLELVATVAEHIIPTTDTPGARAAGVHRYVDALLSGHYPASIRDPFLAGIQQTGQIAQQRHGATFVRCRPADQHALLQEFDAQAYAARTNPTRDAAMADAVAFFRRMKDLTLSGYYMSEIGATKELRVMPWGSYKDVPYSSVGHTWA